MKFRFKNVSGMSFSPRGIVRAICTLLILASVTHGNYKLDVLLIWFAYFVVDGLGEQISKSYWTKEIGENPLEPRKDKYN